MQVLTGPTDVVLVRLAESRGNVADCKAHESKADRLELEAHDADMPLSDLGERQAAGFGRYVARLPAQQQPTAIFASPYARAARPRDWRSLRVASMSRSRSTSACGNASSCSTSLSTALRASASGSSRTRP